MSTDLQKYSTENQLETIRRYAEQSGYTIVHVFEDSGRSGLRMDGRDGLQSLMLKVQSGTADFEAILVYDVSRWERFQDADEGAYHEQVCSGAGIRVHYCGEQFDNDGSIGSILLKNVKRVMAGEFAASYRSRCSRANVASSNTAFARVAPPDLVYDAS
jgi:DNA invertase Pin-like site-specific DNA recombinase